MNKAYLLLGSNEGDRHQWLQKALEAIGNDCGAIVLLSSIYETAAWGLEDQPPFLNLAVLINTNLAPEALLHCTQGIESALGRQRLVKWGQRTLDIDVLFYNNEVIRTDKLVVPHPFLQERRFVLEPLNEIAPEFIHPIFHKSIAVLLEECPDQLPANRQ